MNMKGLLILTASLMIAPLAFAVGEPLKPIKHTVQGIFDKPVVGEMVNLKGSIVEDLGSQRYLFKDETGQIKLTISKEVMVSDKINPEDGVEIFGELKDSTEDKFIIDVSLLKVDKKLRIPNTLYGTPPSFEEETFREEEEKIFPDQPESPDSLEPPFEPESGY